MPFLDPRSKPFTPSSRDLEVMVESAMLRADAAVARAQAARQDAEDTRQAEQEARVERVRKRRARWGV